MRKSGRAAECVSLEKRCRGNPTGGSNPSSSDISRARLPVEGGAVLLSEACLPKASLQWRVAGENKHRKSAQHRRKCRGVSSNQKYRTVFPGPRIAPRNALRGSSPKLNLRGDLTEESNVRRHKVQAVKSSSKISHLTHKPYLR